MAKAEQSLSELLYDLRRIEEHRAVLTDKKIQKIYKSLITKLRHFISDEYYSYADNGTLSYSTLESRARQARFLEEVAAQVDSISPELKSEMLDLAEQTYTNCFEGMSNAILNASDTAAAKEYIDSSLLRGEVVKKSFENSISKLTLPDILERNRKDVIYQVKQVLSIGLINGDRYETMTRRLTDKLNISQAKASNIVRTESHRNIEGGFMDCAVNISDSLEGSDLVYAAIWRTMADERVRPQVRRKTKKGWKTYKSRGNANHVKMEGQTVKAGEKFDLGGGVTARAPGESGDAGNDCNCRCTVEYELMTAEEFAKAAGKKGIANSKRDDIIEVKDVTLEYKPNAVTQRVNKKGGIDRNYYNSDGKLTKQLSNHNHGNAKMHPYGLNGEHAHDYIWENDKYIERTTRKLLPEEWEEVSDIL